jgi:hypothetical protein
MPPHLHQLLDLIFGIVSAMLMRVNARWELTIPFVLLILRAAGFRFHPPASGQIYTVKFTASIERTINSVEKDRCDD